MAEHGPLVERQPVVIRAADGRKTAMEVWGNRLDGIGSHVGREDGVELEEKLSAILVVKRRVGVEMRDEIVGMDAGVRTTSPHDTKLGIARKLAQRISDDLLHGGGVGLQLPPVVVGAVIGEF